MPATCHLCLPNPSTRRGLDPTPALCQVSSWVLMFGLVAGVYAFYMPFVDPPGLRWFLVALYTVLVLCVTALDLVTRCAQRPACGGGVREMAAWAGRREGCGWGASQRKSNICAFCAVAAALAVPTRYVIALPAFAPQLHRPVGPGAQGRHRRRVLLWTVPGAWQPSRVRGRAGMLMGAQCRPPPPPAPPATSRVPAPRGSPAPAPRPTGRFCRPPHPRPRRPTRRPVWAATASTAARATAAWRTLTTTASG